MREQNRGRELANSKILGGFENSLCYINSLSFLSSLKYNKTTTGHLKSGGSDHIKYESMLNLSIFSKVFQYFTQLLIAVSTIYIYVYEFNKDSSITWKKSKTLIFGDFFNTASCIHDVCFNLFQLYDYSYLKTQRMTQLTQILDVSNNTASYNNMQV